MREHDFAAGNILSFDFGLRRIGVAVGQAITGTASPVDTVSNGNSPDWNAISKIMNDWKPSLFIVGLPLSLDGEETPMSALARAFGGQLTERFGNEVRYQDERLTSVDAQREFAGLRAAGGARRKHAARLDAVAAKIILENWLESGS